MQKFFLGLFLCFSSAVFAQSGVAGSRAPNDPYNPAAPVAITNKASGGSIGSASTTVDIASHFNVNQTTASQTLTLANPTRTTPAKLKTVCNVGSASFTFYSTALATGACATVTWNGSAWKLAGDGSGGTPAGSSGDYQINSSGAFGAGVIAQSAGRLTATPTAQSSGAASYFRVITPADTTQTASTEAIGAQFGGNTSAATVTRQWAAGALTTQRENLFVAPTYAFASASTLTNAATLAISGAPVAGTNATITNPYALWVQNGASYFNGAITVIAGGTEAAITVGSTGSITFGGGSVGKQWTFTGLGSNGFKIESQSYNSISLTLSDSFGDALVSHGINNESDLALKAKSSNSTPGIWISSSELVGINKVGSLGAQLHVVSSAAGTIGTLIQGAASNSAAVLVSKLGSSGTGDGLQVQNSSGTVLSAIDSSGRFYAPTALTASTVGAAGGASALPATPTGYLLINVNGTQKKVPYYDN